MGYWRYAVRGLVVAIGLAAFASLAAAADLDGDYAVQGKAPNGKTYSGDLAIKSLGPTEAIFWRLQGNQDYKGLGIRSGDVLGAAYAVDTSYFGIVVYQVKGGVLEGVWSDVRGAKQTGRENLEGPAGLDGEYKITLGEKLDGLTNYTGRVVIKPNGKTYLVAWLSSASPPKPIALGSGVLVGDRLVVAFGDKRIPGVVGYKIDGRNMEGIWSFGGAKDIGTESLTPKP